MAAPWFFLSYSRNDADEFFKQFVADLRDAVRRRVGGKIDDAGFVDTTDIQLGDEWPDALADALQSCRVFVPLYTSSYFKSEFCGKEWAVFRQRVDAQFGGGPGAERTSLIVPVLWVPEAYFSPIPAVATDLQYTHESLGKQYFERGLSELIRLPKRYPDEAGNVIERLADRIVSAANKHALDALDSRPSVVDMPSDFANQATTADGPEFARFVFIVARRDEFEEQKPPLKREYYPASDGQAWRPYLPESGKSVELLVQQVVSQFRDLTYQRVPLDDQFAQHLAEAVNVDAVIALVVDAWTATLPRYAKYLADYSPGETAPNCALIVWNAKDPDTAQRIDLLQGQLWEVFQKTMKQQFLTGEKLFAPATTPTELMERLRAALDFARLRAINNARTKRPVQTSGAQPIISASGSLKP